MTSQNAIINARAYLKERELFKLPDYVDELSDTTIMDVIDAFYIGGWEQFLEDL